MTTDTDVGADALIEGARKELSSSAEALLVLATAIEDRASRTPREVSQQQLRDVAILVRLAVLRLTTSAAGMIRSAERLRVVAERERG